MAEISDSLRDVGDVGVLADPVRRDLYLFVSSQPVPVGRDQAANALGIPHHQAKFQLDRLEEAGLLVADYVRLSGRTGPGAGRPAKIYRRADREISVLLPGREYVLAGELMAAAITEAVRAEIPILVALDQVAAARGRVIGGQARAQATVAQGRAQAAAPADPIEIVLAALIRFGYEPRVTIGADRQRSDAPQIVLANCPFHALADRHTELVCGLNKSLLAGICESIGGLSAHLDPGPGRCCVVLRTAVVGD